MNYSQVKKNILGNTISNYIRTVIGMLVGLVTFRLLYQSFSKDEFGFWSILWSVFGYGILMDFGFGFAAQKHAAELSATKDWYKLSQVVSTIFYVYMGLAITGAITIISLSSHMVLWLGVPPANAAGFQKALIVFILGMGIAFPLGVFPEILRGMQLIRAINNFTTASLLLRLVLTLMALHWHWGYISIISISLGATVLPSFIASIWVMHLIPEIRIQPSRFSRKLLKQTMHFSVVAYFITATGIIISRTDQLVLATFINVGVVALYQVGYKIADIFQTFTCQLLDTLSPAAAALHTTGKVEALRDLLVQSMRWSLLVATPLYILCVFYFKQLLRLLTGDAHSSLSTLIVGHLLLFWYYALLFTHGNSKRIFVMCGHEKRLLVLTASEAIANLFLSIGLVWYYHSMVAVVIGSLIPSLFIGWVLLWPWMAKEAQVSPWSLFKTTVIPAWRACLPMIALLLSFRCLPLDNLPAVIQVIVFGGLGGITGGIGIWFLALDPAEREHIGPRLKKRIPGFCT